MLDEEEKLDVQVEDAAPEPGPSVQVEDEKAAATTQEKPKQADPVEDLSAQFKELQAQSERDKRARSDAESRERSAVSERDRIRAESQETIAARESEAIDAGLAAAETEAKAAETSYKAAFDAGDAAGMATAQRQMARAEARAVRLDEAKADIEARKTRKAEEPRQTETDPVEAFIAGRSAPTAQWLREHREWISDPRKNAKLTAAHWSALGDGIVVDSPEYFESVETYLGLNKKEPPRTETRTAATRPRTPPAAPVQTTGGGMSGGNDNVVRLSKKEAESATDGTLVWNYTDPNGKFKKDDPIGIQEFARRKRAMLKDGLYDKSYMEQ